MADKTKMSAEIKETTLEVKKATPPAEVKEATTETAPKEVEELEKESKEAPPVEEKAAEGDATIGESASFKEESNVVAELIDPQKKALEELKILIEQALKNNEFALPPPPQPLVKPEEEGKQAAGEDSSAAAPLPTAEVMAEKKEVAADTELVKSEEIPASSAPPAVEEKPSPPPVADEKEVKVEVVKVVEEVVPAPVEPPPPAVEPTSAEDEVKTVEAIEETVVPVAPPPPAEPETPAPPPEKIFIWGIPLLGDGKSDTLLLKFLRARDFKVKETLEMIKKTVRWRKEYKADDLIDEDIGGKELEEAVFVQGVDREGHPVCYNVLGNKELLQKAFSATERDHFLRWRIQFLEKGIRQLDFSPDGISTIVQVTDLKGSPGLLNKEVQITTKALSVLLDNYPELVAKQIVINVPWWYLAYTRVFSSIFTPRTKSKIVYVGPSRSTDTLFKYIAPEQIPVQYGGLSKEDESEFSTADAATSLFIKPSSPLVVEIPVPEVSSVVWELRVLGWEVSYGAEFVPDAEDGYTVIISKTRKLAATDEPVIRNSFKVGEPGKVVLKIDNATSKKKKLLHRFKTKVAESN